MKKGFAVVLGLVAVGLVAHAIFFSGGPPVPPHAKASPATPGKPNVVASAAHAAKSTDVDLDELARGVQAVTFQYDPSKLSRNPMTPLVGPQAILASAASGTGTKTLAQAEILAQSMVVTGIVWDPRSPVAVINNDVVGRGDTLPNGAVVSVIKPEEVVVKAGGTTIPLQLKKTEEQ